MIGVLALILMTAAEAKHRKLQFGRCEKTALQANFDASQYMGSWYEIMRGDDIIFERGSECVKVHYKLESDGKVDVYNWSIDKNGKVNAAVGKSKFKGA